MREANHKKRILILSHDASRTGGPVLLLNFLDAVKKHNPDIEIDTIIGWGGPLSSAFSEIGRVLELEQKNNSLPVRAWKKIKRELGSKVDVTDSRDYSPVKAFTNGIEYSVIFSNTIVNGNLLEALQPAKTKIVSYIHELETMIRRFTTAETLSSVLKYTDEFYSPSPVVSKNLIDHHGVAATKISLLPYYIPEVKVEEERSSTLKKKIGAEGCFIIGAAGTSDWRKGADLFLQIAMQVKSQTDQRVKFLWVGADSSLPDQQRLQYDIEKTGMKDDVIFIEPVDNTVDYISIMDVFVLTSREDPYPLVVLEAAMQKKPLLCFDNSGGAVAFVQQAGNIVVPYLDTKAFANELLKIMKNSERVALGEAAYKQYKAQHSEKITVPAFERALGI